MSLIILIKMNAPILKQIFTTKAHAKKFFKQECVKAERIDFIHLESKRLRNNVGNGDNLWNNILKLNLPDEYIISYCKEHITIEESYERIGQTAEHAVCKVSNIECLIDDNRIDEPLSKKLQDIIKPFLEKIVLT